MSNFWPFDVPIIASSSSIEYRILYLAREERPCVSPAHTSDSAGRLTRTNIPDALLPCFAALHESQDLLSNSYRRQDVTSELIRSSRLATDSPALLSHVFAVAKRPAETVGEEEVALINRPGTKDWLVGDKVWSPLLRNEPSETHELEQAAFWLLIHSRFVALRAAMADQQALLTPSPVTAFTSYLRSTFGSSDKQ